MLRRIPLEQSTVDGRQSQRQRRLKWRREISAAPAAGIQQSDRAWLPPDGRGIARQLPACELLRVADLCATRRDGSPRLPRNFLGESHVLFSRKDAKSTRTMKTRPTLLTVLIVSMVFAGALGAWATASKTRTASSPAPGEPTLDDVRRATEWFRDVNVALAEGYIRDPSICATPPR